MVKKEYDRLCKALYAKHSVEFIYDGDTYYIGKITAGYHFYLFRPEERVLIERVIEPDVKPCIDRFLAERYFKGTSLKDNWQNIDVLYIF